MRRIAWMLAWRSLWDRPWRTLVLLGGYGIGVAVMIALLSVGDALLAQARDRDLVAGGDLVLLPDGIDPAVLKVNGVTDLSFTIQQAGFVVRDVLRGARFAREVEAAAPQIDARQIYVRARGQDHPALASGGIPSLDRAARATAAIPGARDTAADAAWIAPSPAELIDRLDRFHHPPPAAEPAWAEWDYFNFVDAASGAYGYLTVLAGGKGRGLVLVRIRRPNQPVEDIRIEARLGPGDLSDRSANQRVGPARIHNEGGRYHITVDDPHVRADLWVTRQPGFYLPPGEISGDGLVSGYVVPVVRGAMSGSLRTNRGALCLAGAAAYHDHNWGTWKGVTWDWGEASGGSGAVLYGGLHTGAGRAAPGQRPPVVFVWQPAPEDGAGVRGAFWGGFPVQRIAYTGWHRGPAVAGRDAPSPTLVTVEAGSGSNQVTVRVRVRDALAAAAGQASATAPGPAGARKETALVAFLQLRGVAEVEGVVDGHRVAFAGGAAAETFVEVPAGLPRRSR